MPITADIFRQRKSNDNLVETGCLRGAGIRAALDAGFNRVISIEIDKHWFNYCCDRFANDNNVILVHGDSATALWPAIQGIDEPITFWLDGHWSSAATTPTVGSQRSPLISELKAIARHAVKQHVLLIDDMRCWQQRRNQYHDGFDHDTIMAAIATIYPNGYRTELIDGYDEVTGVKYSNDILWVQSNKGSGIEVY